MNAIWKYPIQDGETEFEAPIEEFLTIQMQDDTPCVWAIVNPGKVPKKYKVVLVGTGWELQKIDASKYIGTVQIEELVWHCFGYEIPTIKSSKEPTFKMFSYHRIE